MADLSSQEPMRRQIQGRTFLHNSIYMYFRHQAIIWSAEISELSTVDVVIMDVGINLCPSLTRT